MALTFRLADLVAATLPHGQGWVGLVGVEPQGRAYHVLTPVELELVQGLGGRPGWLYRPCRAYVPPPPRSAWPEPEQFRAARRAQALATGRELLAWAAMPASLPGAGFLASLGSPLTATAREEFPSHGNSNQHAAGGRGGGPGRSL